MTASTPANAGRGDLLVCDCWSGVGHNPACVLGQAETTAVEGLGLAASDTHPLTAALVSLTEAGILSPVVVDLEPVADILYGLLDNLFAAGMLARPAHRADDPGVRG